MCGLVPGSYAGCSLDRAPRWCGERGSCVQIRAGMALPGAPALVQCLGCVRCGACFFVVRRLLKCARDALRRTCPVVLLFPLLLRNALDRCSLASMHTSERQRSVAIEGVVLLRACFLQGSKSEHPVIEAPLCTNHLRHSRTASAPKARSVAAVKKRYATPTRTNQNPPFDAGTCKTHQTKTRNRSRECRFPPEYQPPGENPKRGQQPPFWSPEGVGIPKGSTAC